jgi:hypothetical protein
MLSSAGVVVMEFCNLWPGLDLLMYLPAVITCIVAFPLDEILKVVIPHVTIKDLLNFILFSLSMTVGGGEGSC